MSVVALHHASLLVDDLERALGFYCGVMGLERLERPDLGYPGAWLQVGEQQIHLLRLPNPDAGLERPAHGGRDRHIALLVRQLDGYAAQLDHAGVAFTRSRSGRAALFCRDPDGNALELIEVP